MFQITNEYLVMGTAASPSNLLLDLQQRALSASHVVAWEWHVETGACQRSGPSLEELGVAADAPFERFLNMVQPHDRAQLDEALRRTRERLEPCFAQFRITLGNGEQRWIEAHGSPLLDAKGNCFAIVGSMQNIDARKRIEQRLLEVERQLSEQTSLLRQVHDLVLLEPMVRQAQKQRLELLRQALAIDDAQMAVLHSLDPTSGAISVEVVLAPLLRANVRQTLARSILSICEQAMQSGQRLLLSRETISAHRNDNLREVLTAAQIGGLQCTPLNTRDGRLIGTLSILWCGPRMLSAGQLSVLDIIALKLAETQSLPAIGIRVAAAASQSATSPLLADLTPQQRRIAELMTQGRSNRAIAASLQIAENTVKAHVATVLRRLGLHSRVQLLVRTQSAGGRPELTS